MVRRVRFAALAGFVGLIALVGCTRGAINRLEWPVMGTVAAVQSRGADIQCLQGACAVLRSWCQVVVDAFDAHNANSEMNRIAGLSDEEIVEKSPHAPCYRAAFGLMRASDGAFNPRWRGPGTLDFGAIAKGYAVDLAALEVRSGEDVLLDLGGNLKSIRGDWKTGVKSPAGAGFAALVTLREGEALATSATYYRGSHIFDGRTGRPVTNDVASVTVLCTSAMWADGLSTTLFVLGPDEGRVFMERHGRSLCGDANVSVLWLMKNGRSAVYGPAVGASGGRFDLSGWQ